MNAGRIEMAKQLNIRSDEAYEIAHALAREMNTTVTHVLETALREFQKKCAADELTPEQMAFLTDVVRLSERSAAAARPGATSDHRDFYDDKGLPR
jgi:hypothetical protein